MGRILAIIQRTCKRRNCFILSAIGLAGVFLSLGISTDVLLDNFVKGFLAFFAFCCLISVILFLAAGLYDSSRDESTAIKPPRFYTVNEDGKIVLTEVSAPLPLDLKETRRADGKVDISMEIHSKEQAVEVLAALAIMHDKGDIDGDDYRRGVHKIRECVDL